MECPRCKLPLKVVDYEGVEADMCENCWGFWLDTGELEEVLATRSFSFSTEEKEKILDVNTAWKVGATEVAACPRCKSPMQRQHYDETVHLVIDSCPKHGIWLDTGEIKKAQAIAEKSSAVHRMLIQKLGIRRP